MTIFHKDPKMFKYKVESLVVNFAIKSRERGALVKNFLKQNLFKIFSTCKVAQRIDKGHCTWQVATDGTECSDKGDAKVRRDLPKRLVVFFFLTRAILQLR